MHVQYHPRSAFPSRTACAAANQADQAFKLYSKAKAEGVQLDAQFYSALIASCSNSIAATPASDRRTQLVLLQRAFDAFEEMRERKLRADAPVWNALLTGCGRCGQLQRALHTLSDMEVGSLLVGWLFFLGC